MDENNLPTPLFSLAALQEFLRNDGLIAKTHLAVETLYYIFQAYMCRCFSTK